MPHPALQGYFIEPPPEVKFVNWRLALCQAGWAKSLARDFKSLTLLMD
ncbi:MAG: hypothetical protein HY231_14345 [Acidobacteria bacterium]|nr:hypothetical protein [Acidobacteriota bacterium]